MAIAHVVPGRGGVAKAEAIFSIAFNPMSIRVSRSKEYLQGAYAAMVNAASARDADFSLMTCPYSPGSCAHDAWHSGATEGRRLWRINGGL